MADYLYADDGKIHTRYSELVRCTFGQLDRVVAERLGLVDRYTSDRLDFGTYRHEMWQEESEKTGMLPEIFGLPRKVDYIENEFATEIVENVIVHSRPDAVCVAKQAIGDYKTMSAKDYDTGVLMATKLYRGSKQLIFYAYQLGLHGIRIKKIIYLVEIWNEKMDAILGFHAIEIDINLSDIAKILPWTKDRIATLTVAVERGIIA